MRQLSASTDRVQFALGTPLDVGAFLDFTVSFFWRPDSLGGSLGDIFTAGKSGGNRWGCTWEESADRIAFKSVGHGGTDPFTSSGIQLFAADITNGGVWAAYRYSGGEWSKWVGGVKTVINASIAFSLAAAMTDVFIGRNTYATTNAAVGRLGELAIWTQALTDAQMVDLSRGIAADQMAVGALVFYAPLRGTFGAQRELLYVGDLSSVSLSGTTQATHPEIIAYATQEKHEPAWALDIFHPDETVRIATRDLFSDRDVDVLGAAYPGDIRNGESIEVRDELSDGFYGVQVPQSVVVLVKPGPVYRDVVLEDAPVGYWPLTEQSGSTAADATANNLDGSYVGGVTLDMRGGVRGFDADGRAVRFNGSSGYVSVPDNALLDVVGALTLVAWVWVDNRSNYYFLVSKNTSNATPQPFEWRLEQTTGLPQFLHGGGATSVGTRAVPTGSWQMVAVTRAGASGSVVAHYLNAEPSGSGTLAGTIASSATAMRIGSRDDGFSFIPGAMCHVALFDKALSIDRLRLYYRVGLQAWKGRIGHAREWRGVPARLRRYDAVTHELQSELQGVVADVDFAGTAITITTDDAVLSTPIPRRIIDINGFSSATDLGACIGVIAGDNAMLAAPYVGRDDNGGDDPEQRDFMLGHQHNPDGVLQLIKVVSVYEDIETDPGLEKLSEWVAAEGSPTFGTAEYFTVSGDYALNYPAGMPIRFKTTASGSTWLYSFVESYDAAPAPDRVYVADDNLGSGLNSVQIASGYYIERARYSIGGQFLLSLRRDIGNQGSPVVFASNPGYANPATLVDAVLRHTNWGLSQTVNAASVATAVAALSAAGLGSAVVGVLGWNKQQRRADDVLKDLLAIYGGRTSRDASTGEWLVRYDSAPSAYTLTLGFGDGQWGNVTAVRSIRRRSLAEAVQTVRLRFGLKATTSVADGLRGSLALVPEKYQFYVDAECLDVGKTIEITNPYIANASIARRVAYYRAQNLRASDLGIEIEGGMEMRLLRAGDLVRFVDPVHGLDSTYRVWRLTKRLHQVTAELRGYDAAVYTYDSSKVSDTIDVTNREEKATTPGIGANLLLNSDFSAPSTKQSITTDPHNGIPDWSIENTASVTSVALTPDVKTISGSSYLTLVTSSVVGPPKLVSASRFSVEPGTPVIASVYTDRADGWKFHFYWFDSSDVVISAADRPLFPFTGAEGLNGLGWRRRYSIDVAPANAAYGYLGLWCSRATGTFKFDGVQLEKAGRRSHRPTEWKRNARYGVDPAQWTPGPHTIRHTGQPEGSHTTTTLSEEITMPGSGTTKDSTIQIPAGAMLLHVTGRVTQAIGGGVSIHVGIAADTQRFANFLGVTLGTTFDLNNHNGSHVVLGKYAAATAVRISLNGGTFNGTGKVRIVITYAVSAAPTN